VPVEKIVSVAIHTGLSALLSALPFPPAERRSPDRLQAIGNGESSGVDGRRTSVLVVEDNDAERHVICNAIETFTKFSVHSAVNGVDGIKKALSLKPDLIVMDLAMPMMNGLEAAAVLRKELPNVPIVVLSLYAEEIDTPRSTAFGVVRVLSKTDGIRPVLECIQQLLAGMELVADLPIDILRLEEGQLLWLEAAPDVETARSRVGSLAARVPGDYVIFNQRTGNKFIVNQSKPPHRPISS
jgi:CheY-like chemotaxis protein